LVKERVDVFSQLAPMISFFAEGMPEISPESLKVKNVEEEEVKKILQFSLWRLEAQRLWGRDPLNELFVNLAESLGLKLRDVLAPIFVAISGKPVAPPLFDSMAILGPDICRARLRHAVNILGGVSKKQVKRLEKEYKDL
jgi:glutamyl-tRNA synthetase